MFVYEQSFQGKSHKQKNVLCQDRCGHCITPNGWIVAVVADGVSESPLSDIGATIAVDSCLEYFSEFKYSPYLDATGIQLIIRDSFNYALRRIKERENPDNFIPFARITTLHVLLYGEKIGLHWGQAGDGALIIRNPQGNWKRVSSPMKNDEDNNSPIVLQDGAAAWKFGSLDVNSLDSILLTTDGVADVIGTDPADRNMSSTVVDYLMSPLGFPQDSEAVDSYYQDLFSLKATETPGTDNTVNDALSRLSSITDDITVLLISDLQNADTSSVQRKTVINVPAETIISAPPQPDNRGCSDSGPGEASETVPPVKPVRRKRTERFADPIQPDMPETVDEAPDNPSPSKISNLIMIILCLIAFLLCVATVYYFITDFFIGNKQGKNIPAVTNPVETCVSNPETEQNEADPYEDINKSLENIRITFDGIKMRITIPTPNSMPDTIPTPDPTPDSPSVQESDPTESIVFPPALQITDLNYIPTDNAVRNSTENKRRYPYGKPGGLE